MSPSHWARELTVPAEWRKKTFLNYGVKDLLRRARDLLKFISMAAHITGLIKKEMGKSQDEEADQANQAMLY
jgi:hypothetical protein